MKGPVTPRLEPAFTIEAAISHPRGSGRGPMGERLHIPITGGRVHGPRLSGAVLAGGSDWPVVGLDGHSRVDAHYTIEADDGTLIYVHNQGIRVSPPAVATRLRSGEQVDPEDYYFRAVPKFDAPDGPHAWLRETVFVCSVMPRGDRVVVDVYAVT